MADPENSSDEGCTCGGRPDEIGGVAHREGCGEEPPAVVELPDDATEAECEREDCRRIAATASDVYCEITGGLLSYPTYDARTVLAHANEQTQKLVDEECARVRAEALPGCGSTQDHLRHDFPVTVHCDGVGPQVCDPERYQHLGPWEPVKPWQDVRRCTACGTEIGK